MTDSVEVAITSDSSGQQWSVSVWDILTGSQLITYKNGGVCGSHALCLVGKDYIVAAEAVKPLLHVWPVNSTEPSHDLRTICPGTVGSLAVSPNGKFLVAGIAEKIHVWQVEAGRLMCVAARHFQAVTCIRFFEDSSHFVSGGDDGLVLVWNISELTALDGERANTVHSFSDHYLAVKDIYLGHGGSHTRIISVSMDGSCRIYDFASGKLLLSLVVDALTLHSVTADVLESSLFLGCGTGDILAVSLRESPRQLEHHLTEQEKQSVFKGHTGTITALSTSQDASTLLSGSADETVRLWHIESKQCLRVIQHKGSVKNAFITLIPSKMFTEKFEPNVIMHRLQRANNVMEGNDFNFEIMTTRPLGFSPHSNMLRNPFVSDLVSHEDCSSISNEEVLEKCKENDNLKKINLGLFKLAANKLLFSHKENGLSSAESVPSLVNINVALQQVDHRTLDVEPVYKLSKKVKKGLKGAKN